MVYLSGASLGVFGEVESVSSVESESLNTIKSLILVPNKSNDEKNSAELSLECSTEQLIKVLETVPNYDAVCSTILQSLSEFNPHARNKEFFNNPTISDYLELLKTLDSLTMKNLGDFDLGEFTHLSKKDVLSISQLIGRNIFTNYCLKQMSLEKGYEVAKNSVVCVDTVLTHVTVEGINSSITNKTAELVTKVENSFILNEQESKDLDILKSIKKGFILPLTRGNNALFEFGKKDLMSKDTTTVGLLENAYAHVYKYLDAAKQVFMPGIVEGIRAELVAFSCLDSIMSSIEKRLYKFTGPTNAGDSMGRFIEFCNRIIPKGSTITALYADHSSLGDDARGISDFDIKVDVKTDAVEESISLLKVEVKSDKLTSDSAHLQTAGVYIAPNKEGTDLQLLSLDGDEGIIKCIPDSATRYIKQSLSGVLSIRVPKKSMLAFSNPISPIERKNHTQQVVRIGPVSHVAQLWNIRQVVNTPTMEIDKSTVLYAMNALLDAHTKTLEWAKN